MTLDREQRVQWEKERKREMLTSPTVCHLPQVPLSCPSKSCPQVCVQLHELLLLRRQLLEPPERLRDSPVAPRSGPVTSEVVPEHLRLLHGSLDHRVETAAEARPVPGESGRTRGRQPVGEQRQLHLLQQSALEEMSLGGEGVSLSNGSVNSRSASRATPRVLGRISLPS